MTSHPDSEMAIRFKIETSIRISFDIFINDKFSILRLNRDFAVSGKNIRVLRNLEFFPGLTFMVVPISLFLEI